MKRRTRRSAGVQAHLGMRSAAPLLLAALTSCSGSTRPAARAPEAPRTRPAVVATTLAKAWAQVCSGPDSFPMEVHGSREFVMVSLPGSKADEAVRFHVDTGGNTPGLLLRRSVAEHLGFRSADALPRAIRIGNHAVALPGETRWMLLDDDSHVARSEAATRRDFSVGQMGAGFLSRFVVCIDPQNGRLGLGNPKRFEITPGDAKWVPLFMMPGGSNRALYPFVHVLLRDHGAFAGGYGVLIDTGATTSMLDRGKIEYQREHHPHWPTANGASGDADMIGGRWDEELLQAPDAAIDAPRAALVGVGSRHSVSIDVGPVTFVDRPTGTWSTMFGDVPVTMGSHGAIANDVLLRFRLLIDYQHARLFMQPVARTPAPSASQSRVGVSLVFGSDGCPVVTQITDTNDKTTRDQLEIGDVLLAVDGKGVCNSWHHEIAADLAGPPGTMKTMRLRRGKDHVTVAVATADLLAHR